MDAVLFGASPVGVVEGAGSEESGAAPFARYPFERGACPFDFAVTSGSPSSAGSMFGIA
ncbi:MAG: hypothetical protein R3F14_08970 [Polyangiaceae bacterium]